MHYWNGLDEVPADLGPTAVTIGNFDGVHLGHQEVLTQLAAAAAEHEASAVAVSFDPHPAQVHRPHQCPEMITGVQEKIYRLATTGIDAMLMIRYSLDLAALTPAEFVKQYFVDALNVRVVVVGHDVRFGRGNTGSFETMVELGEQYGFAVVGVEDFGRDRRCSSTWVREALAAGDVASAREVLGRPHAVLGEVVHGAARGRELGFPTANLGQDSEGMIPADGVYAGWLTDGHGRRWPAAISVGSNPTFDGVQRVVESFVIGRPKEKVEDFDLYGQQVRVEFIDRLRGMVAFEGIPQLISQMEEDVARAKLTLGTDDPEHLDARPVPAVEG
ncbi:bifunctional riboflavin kinase/FAD synthetase [Nesterenkonia sp. K-15-9-6]|uniref:bifunctional riboflavin kinase/FAD synthetase n=1 Tax=Nesterenkonia sp. K-15-9-6 TaxID=3093918 RepID=UPI0040450C0A